MVLQRRFFTEASALIVTVIESRLSKYTFEAKVNLKVTRVSRLFNGLEVPMVLTAPSSEIE